MKLNLHFGPVAKAYDKGRRQYPKRVIDYVVSFIGEQAHALDLGCGTGIAARQLAEAGIDIQGCEADERMLAFARRYEAAKIRYTNAPAHDMPYDNNTFDAVTMFSAFHWFCNPESSSEIYRVLRPEGRVIAVNQKRAGIRVEYRRIIEGFIENLPEERRSDYVQRNYKPEEVLEQSGFRNVAKANLTVHRSSSIEDEIALAKTTNIWTEIPDELVIKVLEEVRDYIVSIAVNGKLEEDTHFYFVSGIK